jgi:hypothetical protein
VYLKAAFYVKKKKKKKKRHEQSDCASSHLVKSKCIYEILRCENTVFLTSGLFDMANCATVTSLSLVTLCIPSTQTVTLKLSSLHTFASKSPKRIHIVGCPLYHHFYRQSAHVHSEKYYTNGLLILYTTTYQLKMVCPPN